MKAAILLKKNEPLVVEDIELPTNLRYGQVKVKVLVSGLCGAQLQEIAGLKNNEKFMPHLIGHEGCGLVEDVGEGVTKVKKGDKVVLHWRKGGGIDSGFPVYIRQGKPMSGNRINTLLEYAVVSETRLTKIDQTVDNEFAALLGCGLSTGFAVVNKDANIKFGESVLVIGCGGVGLNCIRAAAMSHAMPVVGVDVREEKRTLVEKNGGIFYSSGQLEEVKKMTFDCIIDTTGLMELISFVLPSLSEQGRCILVAMPKPDAKLTIFNPPKLYSVNGQSIRTTQAGGFDPDVDIPHYIKLFRNNAIDLDALITHRYTLDEINVAVNRLRSGDCGRIMIHI